MPQIQLNYGYIFSGKFHYFKLLAHASNTRNTAICLAGQHKRALLPKAASDQPTGAQIISNCFFVRLFILNRNTYPHDHHSDAAPNPGTAKERKNQRKKN